MDSLSENSEFANACAKAGIAFIGPPASPLKRWVASRQRSPLMEKAKVPLVPGYHGDNQDPDFGPAKRIALDIPCCWKASAGGGGKGMRVIEKAADFKEGLASCKREAINSFGDDKVLAEKYLQRPRHIEIQVFADAHGNWCICLSVIARSSVVTKSIGRSTSTVHDARASCSDG